MCIVSFIIPYYSGEKTIFTMLDSIFAMWIKTEEFEIIIVDDCSPISAESVLYEFVAAHSNVRIIRQQTNKRQGGAKNTGIRAAKGKYIVFADQDDIIHSRNMCAALEVALQNDVDMLSCHYNVLNEDGTMHEEGIKQGEGMMISGKEFCECYFFSGYNLAPWANLYKRDFLLRVARPYEENVVMEDSDWIAWHWIHADKIGIFNQPIYIWVMNPNSITHSNHYINRADWIKFGYRKIRDAKLYASYSPTFSHIMTQDGYENIKGGFMKLWKVDDYAKFYNHIGVNVMQELQKIEWKQPVKFMIHYPMATCRILFVLGSILKGINNVRHKIIKL